MSINSSTLIQLKAQLELHRPKEIQEKQITTKKIKTIKQPIEPTPKEESKWQQSYVALQRKSELYEELRKESKDDDSLVDFIRKPSEEEIPLKQVQERWIEITDEYGRTRLIKKEDIQKQPSIHFVKESGDIQEDVHYDPNKERRNMGTSYYSLSKDSDERLNQLNNLNSLRKETIQERGKKVDGVSISKKRLEEQRMRILNKKKQNMASGKDDGGNAEEEHVDKKRKV